jgi:glycerol-3-phosphate dehydrogenase (NAD+)
MAAFRTVARRFSTAGSEKIAMVGSGNFGSALVRILGRNAMKHDVFDNEVKMSVHEEMIDGKPLTEIINETNENVKYLKGAKFTPNVVADPDISSAVSGATMICFCLPHQFLKPMVPKIVAAAAPGVKCLSAIKGIDFDESVRADARARAVRTRRRCMMVAGTTLDATDCAAQQPASFP